MCKLQIVLTAVVYCMWLQFGVDCRYSYENQWNSWIMFPARGKSTNQISDNSLKFSKTVSSVAMPLFYNPRVSGKMNISEPLVISFKRDNDREVQRRENRSTIEKEKNDRALGELSPFGESLGRVVTKVTELFNNFTLQEFFHESPNEERGKKKKLKTKKLLKKFIVPLLLAYKLKFFTLIPVFMGALLLLVGSTGMAGFFFALFAAMMGLRGEGQKW